MIKKLFVIILIPICSFTYAQTIKTDVLVIGGNTIGIACAVQCARSKVKTVLVEARSILADNLPPGDSYTINSNKSIPSGTWGEFRARIRDFYKGKAGYDTTYNGSLKFERTAAQYILKKVTDTVKNLTIYLNSSFAAIKKDGDRWEVTVSQNKKTIVFKARVIVDATETGGVAAKVNAKFKAGIDINQAGPNGYRTAIAAGDNFPVQVSLPNNYPPPPAWYICLKSVVLKDAENILVTQVMPTEKTAELLPVQFQLGQGIGTIAAYCAFFKTTTKNLKVRVIQGELLDYKGYILPFTDISPRDPSWRAVQQVCATGLLKGVRSNAQFKFEPDAWVLTAEVKPVLTEIYTRAFLWFAKEKPGEKFTLGNLLSFISDYTLTDPQTLHITMQKAWKTQYKFAGDFDLARPVTRREFAVLTNKFLNPFARTVDLEGRLVN
ncbi:MAG: FAD-dependent oxidoreductase [Bacteroidota bacterium]|nr:FAD-dependent oxidoreductase [Bacteroidota bacterium]